MDYRTSKSIENKVCLSNEYCNVRSTTFTMQRYTRKASSNLNFKNRGNSFTTYTGLLIAIEMYTCFSWNQLYGFTICTSRSKYRISTSNTRRDQCYSYGLSMCLKLCTAIINEEQWLRSTSFSIVIICVPRGYNTSSPTLGWTCTVHVWQEGKWVFTSLFYSL